MVAVEREPVGAQQRAGQGVEVASRDLDRAPAALADQVAVDRAGQVVDGGGPTEVRVDDQAEGLELLEDRGRRSTG